MNRTRPLALLAAALAAATLSSSSLAAQARADSGALVTVLGRDTLVLERWVRHGDSIVADVVVRAPRTTMRRHVLRLNGDGTMRSFEETVLDSAGRPARVERVERVGEHWVRTVTGGENARRDSVQAPASALPFVDLVHWPYEVALLRATAAGARSGEAALPLLSGGRMIPFRMRWPAADSVELTHPMRGTMTARVDADGRLRRLDAAQTTRKVVVTRGTWTARLPEQAMAWSRADAAGRGVGELSGRGSEDATVAGARITVDYGTPSRRGREIFGAVVPWGQVWRTGANRATHLRTDRALVLGDPMMGPTLRVPAGEYTLFSIPGPDGGMLIVNTQTGQNGTAYDPARDLGRVRMRIGKLGEEVERFTIRVVPAGAGGGALNLSWDRAQFTVPFTVAGAGSAEIL